MRIRRGVVVLVWRVAMGCDVIFDGLLVLSITYMSGSTKLLVLSQ
jgi:hypothetical protein